ncbi:hypothetical protein BaRGS_00004037, partial [Batillaria attramentaria]
MSINSDTIPTTPGRLPSPATLSACRLWCWRLPSLCGGGRVPRRRLMLRRTPDGIGS